MHIKSFSEAELRARPGRKWHFYPDDVLPAWIAEMDFGIAEPIQQRLQQIVEQASYGYEGGSGAVELAESFAEHMQRQFGWSVASEHVQPVGDLVQALFTSVSAFTAPGDGVVLQTPIYPPFQHAVLQTGRRIIEHRLVDDGARFVMDLASLRDRLSGAALVLLCNPHNPTGRVFERPELEALAEAVIERDLLVIADEVHADLTYPGHVHIPFASLGPEVAQRTVTITSATKAYNIPGLRCGLMHFGSAGLRERFRSRIPDRMLGIPNGFGMRATVVAWRDCAAWLEEARDVLRGNRERLTGFMAAQLPEVGFHAPEATFLAWLDCSKLDLGMSPHQFFLQRARVGLNDGAEFGPTGQAHVRLNFGTSPAILEAILHRMAAATP